MEYCRYKIVEIDCRFSPEKEHLYVGSIVGYSGDYVAGEKVTGSIRIEEAPEGIILGMQFVSGVILKKIDVTISKDSLFKEVIRVSNLIQKDIDEIDRKWGKVTELLASKNKYYKYDKKRVIKGIALHKKVLNIHTMSFDELEEYLNTMYDYLNLGGLNTKIKARKPYGVSDTEIKLQLGIPQSILQNWKNKTKNSWEFKLYNMLKHGSWGV